MHEAERAFTRGASKAFICSPSLFATMTKRTLERNSRPRSDHVSRFMPLILRVPEPPIRASVLPPRLLLVPEHSAKQYAPHVCDLKVHVVSVKKQYLSRKESWDHHSVWGCDGEEREIVTSLSRHQSIGATTHAGLSSTSDKLRTVRHLLRRQGLREEKSNVPLRRVDRQPPPMYLSTAGEVQPSGHNRFDANEVVMFVPPFLSCSFTPQPRKPRLQRPRTLHAPRKTLEK